MNKADIEQKSDSLFAKFTKGLAKTNLAKSIALPVAIGLAGAVYGAGVEAGFQAGLLESGGQAALDAYIDMMKSNSYSNIPDYVMAAIKGESVTYAGNISGVSLGAIVYGPVATASSVLLARGIEFYKSMTGNESDNKNENEDLVKEAREEESPSIHNDEQIAHRRPKIA